jgi:hypothetical protein
VSEGTLVRVPTIVNVGLVIGQLAFAVHRAIRGVVVLDGRRYAGPALGFLAGVPASVAWYSLRAAQVFVRREAPVLRRSPGRLVGIDPRQRGEVLVRAWAPLKALIDCALPAFAMSEGL